MGNPWPSVIVANLLGPILLQVIRLWRGMHPVAALKHEASRGDSWGLISGLLLGAFLGTVGGLLRVLYSLY